MTSEEQTRKALIDALKVRGTQARVAEALEVSATTVMRWKEGEGIPGPMLKLLRLYLFGEIPFESVHAKTDSRSVLSFTEEEWRVIGILAKRSGVEPGIWIRNRIREYLAFLDARKTAKTVVPFKSAESWSRKHPLPRVADGFRAPFRGGVAAGEPADATVDGQWVSVDRELPAGHYVVRVHGNSMEPTVTDGSLIEVRELRNGEYPSKGDMVIYTDGMGATLKRLAYRKPVVGEEELINNMGKVAILTSDNPAFTEIQTMDTGRISSVYVSTLSSP